MKKIVLFAFKGEAMCFSHVLLHALDLFEKGYEVKIVVEGAATALVEELDDENWPFTSLYQVVRDKGLIDCVCEACSRKTGSLGYAKAQGLKVDGEMKGHPALERFLRENYKVIVF